MFQNYQICMSRQIVDCIMEILTLISMSMQKQTLLYSDQRYLNEHYRLKHVSRF